MSEQQYTILGPDEEIQADDEGKLEGWTEWYAVAPEMHIGTKVKDWSPYQFRRPRIAENFEQCKICKGSGFYAGETCEECGGDCDVIVEKENMSEQIPPLESIPYGFAQMADALGKLTQDNANLQAQLDAANLRIERFRVAGTACERESSELRAERDRRPLHAHRRAGRPRAA